MRRSPRHAPGGAEPNPDTRANATPSMAISTPMLLRHVSASTPRAAPTARVRSGKGREGERAARGRRVDERRVEQKRKEREEKQPKTRNWEPVATLGPSSAAERGERRKQEHANAEAKGADRERIHRSGQIARGADRAAAERAREHGGQHSGEFAQRSPSSLLVEGIAIGLCIKKRNFI